MNAAHQPPFDGPRPRDLDEGLRELARLWERVEATRHAPAHTFDRMMALQDERFGLVRRVEALESLLRPSTRGHITPTVYRTSDGRHYRVTVHGQFVPVAVVDAWDVPFVEPPAPAPIGCSRDLPEREALCGCVACVEDRAAPESTFCSASLAYPVAYPPDPNAR